jgi:predicted 3-demethylubiquinone-9 3-methyltransferase (glyoxalase superfamily)
MANIQKITPFLWFDKEAEEAANFYVSVFNDSKILSVSHYDQASSRASGLQEGSVMTVSFELEGQLFTALNGGPVFKFNESVSFVVNCETQEEIDKLWKALSAHPESEQCGWLKDKFGLSWQIVPKELGKLLSNPNATKALMAMKKINIDELKKA